MDIYCNSEHDKLRKIVRDFAENEIRPIILKLDSNEEFSEDIIKKIGELDLLGINVPKKYGGHEKDMLSYIIAIEELARVDSSHASTIAAHNSLGVAPILNYGTEKQKNALLPQLCTGDKLWSFGMTEPSAGSDSNASKTTASLDKGKWTINGLKKYITNGSASISLGTTVQCVTGIRDNSRKELSVILVENGTKGFTHKTMKGKMCWRAGNTSELFFDNCEVPEENLLGEKGKGSKIMLDTLDSGRLSISAMGVGCAQGAYELALKYAQERRQFEKPIFEFQAISFKLADMAMKIELARNLLYKACWLKSKKQPYRKYASMSKLYSSEIAREVTDDAVQIHGANGLMSEHHIERYYRDQRLLQIGEGTSEIQRLIISREIKEDYLN